MLVPKAAGGPLLSSPKGTSDMGESLQVVIEHKTDPDSALGSGARASDRPRKGFQPQDIALIAVFAAMIAALAAVPPIFMVGGVPFALQMLVVILIPLVLGSVRGGAACGLYVLVGLLGVPVFGGQQGGPGALLGASGGYFIGFILSGFIAGALATMVLRRRPRRPVMAASLYGVALVSVALVYVGGVTGQMVNASLSLHAAIVLNLPLLALDLVKAAVAVMFAMGVFTAFPKLLPVRNRG